MFRGTRIAATLGKRVECSDGLGFEGGIHRKLERQRVVWPTPPLIEAKHVGQPEDYTTRGRVE